MKRNLSIATTPIVFIHIPKTAGTSFRKAAEKCLGEKRSCKDYGKTSEETSSIVHKWMINSLDPWQFKKAFSEEEYLFFCGHVAARRYLQVFGSERSLTFFREPLQRIASEFKHYVRYYNYKKDFEDFYRSKQFINKQSRAFTGMPWQMLGFIGITEKYSASIELFNNHFDVHFQTLDENIGRNNLAHFHRINHEQIQELSDLNKDDILLYQQACQQFNIREKLAKIEKVFVRGMIGEINNRRMTGWAVYDKGDSPVEIDFFANGKYIGNAIASESRPQLQALGIRRSGFVGFSIEVPFLSAGDEINAIVVDTGQPLANCPWIVP